MINVLFVCLGNICRSPLAEGIFKNIIIHRGLEGEITCDSAGTAAYHLGENPDPRSIKIARTNGINLQHKGQQLLENHFQDFEYIIAMDQSNLNDIQYLKKRCAENNCNVYLMREFDPKGKGDVPDPYFGGEKGFEEVYDMLLRSCNKFIDFLIKKHNLNG